MNDGMVRAQIECPQICSHCPVEIQKMHKAVNMLLFLIKKQKYVFLMERIHEYNINYHKHHRKKVFKVMY